MGKAAGVWKKIKAFAKTTGQKIGKAASWLNENVLKPAGKVIKPVIDIIDPTGLGTKIYDGVTKVIDYGNEHYGYTPDDSFANTTEFIGDVVMDTQRTKEDKKYKDPFSTAIKLHNEVNNSKMGYDAYKRIKKQSKAKQKEMDKMRNNFKGALDRYSSGESYDDYDYDSYRDMSDDEYDYDYDY